MNFCDKMVLQAAKFRHFAFPLFLKTVYQVAEQIARDFQKKLATYPGVSNYTEEKKGCDHSYGEYHGIACRQVW